MGSEVNFLIGRRIERLDATKLRGRDDMHGVSPYHARPLRAVDGSGARRQHC